MSGEKVRKVEMNNEIVLLRQSVRKARICVINKLIREVKKLRNNHGDEKKMEKNKNKADKLLREVQALKLIKDDEISKYGINNIENVENIIKNSSSDDRTIAMAKVVRYKSLSAKITVFKEKFPDYEKYSTSANKKKSTSKKKNVKSSADGPSKTITKKQSSIDTDGSKVKKCTEKTEKHLDEPSSSPCQKQVKDNTEDSDDSTVTASVRAVLKVGTKKPPEKDKENPLQSSKENKESTPIVRVISKEATVKRFTEILQESTPDALHIANDSYDHRSLDKPASEERVEDDFFLGSRGFLNVVHPDKTDDGNGTAWTRESGSSGFFNVSHGNPRDTFYKGKRRVQRDDAPRKWNHASESHLARPKHKKADIVPVKRSRREYPGGTAGPAESENLHPSWVAKKKQQDIMRAGFQGKKILFEED